MTREDQNPRKPFFPFDRNATKRARLEIETVLLFPRLAVSPLLQSYCMQSYFDWENTCGCGGKRGESGGPHHHLSLSLFFPCALDLAPMF